MLHHPHNNNQVDHKHQNHRNQRCLEKSIRIPDCVIRRQTVTVIIHRHYHIFEYRVSQNISSNRRQQRYDHWHGKVMPYKFSLCITGSAQRSDSRSFFCNSIADRDCKDKSDNYNQNIQKYTTHGFIRSHIIGCKIDRRIAISWCVVFQFVVRNNDLCQQGTHEIVRLCFFLCIIFRLVFILPGICIMHTLMKTVKSLRCDHCHIKFQSIKHQICRFFMQCRIIDICQQTNNLIGFSTDGDRISDGDTYIVCMHTVNGDFVFCLWKTSF